MEWIIGSALVVVGLLRLRRRHLQEEDRRRTGRRRSTDRDIDWDI